MHNLKLIRENLGDFKNKISSAKLKFMRTWDQRVNEEKNILENIVTNN